MIVIASKRLKSEEWEAKGFALRCYGAIAPTIAQVCAGSHKRAPIRHFSSYVGWEYNITLVAYFDLIKNCTYTRRYTNPDSLEM